MPNRQRIPIAVSVAILSLALAACTNQPKRWEKAGTEKQTRWVDIDACGRYARTRMNDADLRQEERFHGRAIALEQSYRNHDVSGLQRLQEADYLRVRRRVFEDCMALKGYRPSRARPKDDSS